METKGAEDVLGGADSWKNVDKTEGMLFLLCRRGARRGTSANIGYSQVSPRRLRMSDGILPTGADSQCRRTVYELLQMRRMCYGMA